MKRKSIAIILGIVLVVVASLGATFLWFYQQKQVTNGKGKAAKINLFTCTSENIIFENVLPGQPISTDGNVLLYEGTRDAIIQFALTGDVLLPIGSENHPDFLALSPATIAQDYTFDGTQYKMTEKRMNEVLSLMGAGKDSSFPGGSIHYRKGAVSLYYFGAKNQKNTFYVYVTEDYSMNLNLVALLHMKISGELGGVLQGSPSRQFEQQVVFSQTGFRATAVQVTKEAISDVLGTESLAEVEDMITNYPECLPNGPVGPQWDYTA